MSLASRPRVRDVGLSVGTLPPGRTNAITDVQGVRVGHATLIRGERVRTGVTAVIPRPGNLLKEPVAGAVYTWNGFGKLMGSTQVDELGEIETPILLTSTLNVPRVADALIDYVLDRPGNETVRSVNPLVAETNDGSLNDARARSVGREEVFAAIDGASADPPPEGTIGAGTGTIAFGFKGGIGSASRRLPNELGGHSLGALVQTNYGGLLSITGVPVGLELRGQVSGANSSAGGSVIVVIATDAPLGVRDLRRLGRRAALGIARTGSSGSSASGDYSIAFSTRAASSRVDLETLDALFAATIEATEEAVYNSLFRATTLTGCGRTVEALPLEPTLEVLQRYRAISPR